MVKRLILLLVVALSMSTAFSMPASEAKVIAKPKPPTSNIGCTPDKPVDPTILSGSKAVPGTTPFVPKPDVKNNEYWMQVDSEPRMNSASQLDTFGAQLITPDEQQFTIYFKEPMDRTSVEKTLKANVGEREVVIGDTCFSFHWKSDSQVVVTADQKRLPAKNEYYFLGYYKLNLKGAKTKTGKTISSENGLTLYVKEPKQLYKVTTDGSKQIKLTSFKKSNESLILSDPAQRYLLVQRYAQYCECDGPLLRFSSLYDLLTKAEIKYPVELKTNYMGAGTFVADTRGFFYPAPDAKVAPSIPKSNTAYRIALKDYVHGSGFSKDRNYLFVALGTKEQKTDFDLGIYHLKTGKLERHKKALKGHAPINQVSDQNYPVYFQDEGQYAYIRLEDYTGTDTLITYSYDWKTKKVAPWKSPEQVTYLGFKQSTDGIYRYFGFTEGKVYKGNKLHQVVNNQGHDGVWIPGTHKLAYVKSATSNGGTADTLHLYDADQKKEKTIRLQSNDSKIIGATPDGNWLFVVGWK
ncbi:hypothetical protein [Brevibacillus daliensis]|uniref:hypothetical protein n=1 Tax=Brevibacillus daliensis TaxID=2892995 RepID=UPI001E2D1196|nr:hypothetical protein [Brevibacillus daliensis]